MEEKDTSVEEKTEETELSAEKTEELIAEYLSKLESGEITPEEMLVKEDDNKSKKKDSKVDIFTILKLAVLIVPAIVLGVLVISIFGAVLFA